MSHDQDHPESVRETLLRLCSEAPHQDQLYLNGKGQFYVHGNGMVLIAPYEVLRDHRKLTETLQRIESFAANLKDG